MVDFTSFLNYMNIIRINQLNPENEYILEAADYIRRGKAVVLPTDTVYGLVVDALQEDAVRRLFKIKKRPAQKPVPLMVKDIAMAKELAYISKKQEKILEAVWPGPITVILSKKKIVSSILTAGQTGVGLRIPDYELTRLLIEKLNKPLTSTSANISGDEPMLDAQEIIYAFKSQHPQPDLLLDAGRLPDSAPSTVLDLTGSRPKILRIGPSSKEDLLKLLEM